MSNFLKRMYWRIYTLIFILPFLGSAGWGIVLESPSLLIGLGRIRVGRNTRFRRGVRLEVVGKKSEIIISIGKNCNIEQNVQIIGINRVVIEDEINIAGNVAIVDVVHPHWELTDKKIGSRIYEGNTYVEIGRGSLIGYGAVILPNTRIGPYSVVGANAVVKGDFPERSVIAGVPAKLLKNITN